MSHRATFLALAALLTVGTSSAAFAQCCGGEYYAPPVVYAAPTGCGGCGAPIMYGTPIAAAPITVGGCGSCGAPSVTYVQPVAPPVMSWGNGCGGCGRAPLYVVNQGPNYTGPGIMVPYRTYTPPMAVGPYPYMTHYRPRYAHAWPARHFYHPMRHWRPVWHRPLGVRG